MFTNSDRLAAGVEYKAGDKSCAIKNMFDAFADAGVFNFTYDLARDVGSQMRSTHFCSLSKVEIITLTRIVRQWSALKRLAIKELGFEAEEVSYNA